MQALPSVLDPAQDKARAALRTGWRPPYADGPTRSQLADLITRPPRQKRDRSGQLAALAQQGQPVPAACRS